MLPEPCASIPRPTACAHRKAPVRFTSTTKRKSSGETSTLGSAFITPAPFIENVDPAEGLFRLAYCARDILRLGDVRPYGERAASQILDSARRLLYKTHPSAQNGHGGARFRQTQRHRSTQTRARSRHQGHFSVQTKFIEYQARVPLAIIKLIAAMIAPLS